MKFTQRQQQAIEKIISQEMQSLKEGWSHAESSKKSSLLAERNLFEAAPIEQDLSEDSVFSALEQVSMDEAQSCMIAFDNEVLNHIATVLRGHGLLASGAAAGDVYEMLADFAETNIVDAQMECTTDIKLALEKYAAEVAKIAADMYAEPKK